MDREFLQQIRQALNTLMPGATKAKKLRYFTARDCHAYAEASGLRWVHTLAERIQEADLVTVGEVVARAQAFHEAQPPACPRCEFEDAISRLVYAGEFMTEHYKGRDDQLTDSEQKILAACRGWLTDDTIARCLADD